MRTWFTGSVFGVVALVATALPLTAWAERPEVWEGYLDYAYVYSSADAENLAARLDEYGGDAGSSLDAYIARHIESDAAARQDRDSASQQVFDRREATAWLLIYLARDDAGALAKSVAAAERLLGHLEKAENRYWFHYVGAHAALEAGKPAAFSKQLYALWLHAVAPLESHYASLEALALDQAPAAGFVSALPYLHENLARLILLRSPALGVDRDLDTLTPLVRLLHEGRVGAHPEVIPLAASAKPYLDRIVQRLDGPESDGGSLTFTLALFEASKHHNRARGLLAGEGLSPATLQAMRLASGAYATAYDRAYTLQGRAAVYTRGLRQLGELYAAKQRLGVDPEIEVPVSIEGAIGIYAELHAAGANDRWRNVGYAEHGRPAYIEGLHGLWQEIQEALLNAADYHLASSREAKTSRDAHSRDAARLYAQYLSFFLDYANAQEPEGVPDSAYFAAYEAAKGVGDAYLFYAKNPTGEEIDLAVARYRGAMSLFPFDRGVWSSLATALERQGRESAYLDLVKSTALAVTRSRALDRWITADRPGALRIDRLRRAFSDSSAVLYLGFGEGIPLEEFESDLASAEDERESARAELAALRAERDVLWSGVPAVPSTVGASFEGPVLPPVGARRDLDERIAKADTRLARLERVTQARAHVLPLYRDTLASEGIALEIRARRDHPVHQLLRRIYYEIRS